MDDIRGNIVRTEPECCPGCGRALRVSYKDHYGTVYATCDCGRGTAAYRAYGWVGQTWVRGYRVTVR